MLDVYLKPGERKTVWVQLERKNCDGPVGIAVGGLPLQGLAIAPWPLPSLSAKLIAYPFEIAADPAAEDSKSLLGVTASLGDARKTIMFNVYVRKNEPAVVPKKIRRQITDKLTNADLLDKVRTNSRCKSFPIPLKAGNTYVIDMVSNDFDSYLRIESGKGVPLAANDDSGGGLNARITFIPTEDDTYYLVATSFETGGLGQFTITVR